MNFYDGEIRHWALKWHNLRTRQKLRTSEAKKAQKFAKRWVTTSGKFTLLFLEFYQTFSIPYIEIEDYVLSQIFVH